MRWLYVASFMAAFLGTQACSSAEPASRLGGDEDRASDPALDDGRTGDPEEENTTVLTPVEGDPIAPVSCRVTFRQHVYPRVVEQWRCGSAGCHGGATANAPAMDTSDAASTYAAWTGATHLGMPLVAKDAKSAKASALSCLIAGTCGQRMPYQGVSEADRALVDGWLSCGAPF